MPPKRKGLLGSSLSSTSVPTSFLGACPCRRLSWDEEDGRAVLLRPKLGESRLGRWAASHLKNPYYRIRLDEIGTLVWRLCDGQTQLSEVVAHMRRDIGGGAEPAEERLYEFIRKMYHARLIGF